MALKTCLQIRSSTLMRLVIFEANVSLEASPVVRQSGRTRAGSKLTAAPL